MKMSRVSECALHMFNRSGSKAQQRLIKLNFCGCDFNGVAFIRSSLVRSRSLHKCAHVDATIDVRRRGASFFRSRHTNQLGKSMSFTRNPFIKYINSIYFDVHHFDVDFMFLWDYLASFNINSLSLSLFLLVKNLSKLLEFEYSYIFYNISSFIIMEIFFFRF